MPNDSERINNLTRILRGWDRRLRLSQTTRWLPRGLMAGAGLALLIAILARVLPLLTRQELILLSVGLVVGGLLITLLVIWLQRRDPVVRAVHFDILFDLRERMSTALELALGRIPTMSAALAAEQYQETMQAAAGVDPNQRLPLMTDWREWGGAGLLSAALVAAILIPNPQQDVLAQQAAVEEAIAEEIERIESLRERIEADETLTAEEREEVLEILDNTIETLEQNNISQEEAVAAMEQAEQDLRDLSEEFADERQEALEEAAGALDGTPADEVGEALEEGSPLEAAEALSDLDVENLTPEEQEQLAEALEQAAGELADSNPELSEALQEAADALQNGDLAGAQEALEEAADDLAAAAGENVEQVEEFADELDRSASDVASAGSEGQGTGEANQPGAGGMGQSQPGGQGSQEGEGGAGGGAGRGEDQGGAVGSAEGDSMDTDNGPGDGGETEYEGIYAPERIGGEGGEEVDIPGDPGAGEPTGVEGDFAENPEGDSTVSYDEVFGDYDDAVNEALDNGYIPLGLRDLIHDYFSGLDPDN